MSTLEVDQSGDIGHAHHSQRQILIHFMNHLKANGYLEFSYPMPDQERKDGWMMFLYARIPDDVLESFEE